jgi:hypothetical protein
MPLIGKLLVNLREDEAVLQYQYLTLTAAEDNRSGSTGMESERLFAGLTYCATTSPVINLNTRWR